MDDERTKTEAPPDEVKNTATPPRRLTTVLAVLFIGGSVVAVGWVRSGPIFGVGLGHPLTIICAVVIVLTGVWWVIKIWEQTDEEWRKVPDGPLSPEVRALADAGKTVAAINRLVSETGAGISEASQVIHK